MTCIYVVGLLPVELNFFSLFFFFFFFFFFFGGGGGPPKINGSNSKLSLLCLHNLEKKEKNYEDINTTVSFSVLSLLSFSWLFAPYNST